MPTTIPILPSADFEETARFYAGLGFQEQGRWPGAYLILAHPEAIELHVCHQPAVEACTNDVACYIRYEAAADAQALHDRWAAGLPAGGRLHAPTRTDYGLLEFALLDPHGNLLRIGGRVAHPSH